VTAGTDAVLFSCRRSSMRHLLLIVVESLSEKNTCFRCNVILLGKPRISTFQTYNYMEK
jgi:hypothetical protein